MVFPTEATFAVRPRIGPAQFFSTRNCQYVSILELHFILEVGRLYVMGVIVANFPFAVPILHQIRLCFPIAEEGYPGHRTLFDYDPGRRADSHIGYIDIIIVFDAPVLLILLRIKVHQLPLDRFTGFTDKYQITVSPA